eukprot:scaffold1830_cov117-Cylindrotheca_fusiformis.AAC.21
MSSLNYMESDTMKVEHIFTFKLGDKLDKPVRRAAESGLNVASHFAESFRFIAIGIAAYFVLSGASLFIASIRGNSGTSSGSSSHNKHSTSSSSKSSSKSSSSKSPKPKSQPTTAETEKAE